MAARFCRIQANYKKSATGGFIGLGKLLDGAAYLAKYTGLPEVIERKREIARVLADTQDADGYIGYFAQESRMCKLWDLHEIGFIIQGLVSDWELFGEKRSLEAARKAADYVMRRWPDMPDGWEFDDITDRETTLGLAHGFIRLAAATSEIKYLDFAKNERALMDWNAPIVLGRNGMIYGQAYGFLGTALEQLELYGREANQKLLRTSFRGLEHMTRNDGLLIDGTGGIAECWTDDQDGEGSVGETCFIAFQFLFYDRLLRLGQGDAALLGDLMERLAYNALPAAQSRDGIKRGDTSFGVPIFAANNALLADNALRRLLWHCAAEKVIPHMAHPAAATRVLPCVRAKG